MKTTSMLSIVLFLMLLQAPARCQFTWTIYPGNPLLRDGFRLVDPCVLYDSSKGQYDLWYVDGYRVKRGVSPDGQSWTLTGAVQSLSSLFSLFFTSAAEVVKSGAGYRLYCTCDDPGQGIADIRLATSADGNVWSKHSTNPVLARGGSGAWDSERVGFPKVAVKDGMYYMFYLGEAGGTSSIGLATSPDGVTWQKCGGNPVLKPDDLGDPKVTYLYPSGVVFNKGLFYLAFLKVNEPGKSVDSLCLATSPDGWTWSVYAGNPIITPSGSWSAGGVGNGSLRYIDGEYRMWYAGHAEVPPGAFVEWVMGGATSEEVAATPAAPELVYPLHSMRVTNYGVPFVWRKGAADVIRYWFELASDSLFIFRITDSTLVDTSRIVMLPNVGTYWWRVKARSSAGWGEFSLARCFTYLLTGFEGEGSLPADYSLEQNYPNPFNPMTTIRYSLPAKSSLRLMVFNPLGQRVAVLAEGEMEAGTHEAKFDGAGLPSGLYFCQLRAAGFVQVRRMLLLR